MPATPKPLAGQVIVLTGASNGIGLCTAQLAAQQGARLVLVARNTQLVDSLMAVIRSSGGQAIHVAADVTVREQVRAAAQAAIAQFGRIDTWINNAGVAIYGRLDEVNEADSRHLFDVNFWGVVNGSLAAMPYLISAHGSLINVGAEVTQGLGPLQGMYASSKQAVKGFTDALRAEMQQVDGVSVAITLIRPSGLDPQKVAEAIIAAVTRRQPRPADPGAPAVPQWMACRDAARREPERETQVHGSH